MRVLSLLPLLMHACSAFIPGEWHIFVSNDKHLLPLLPVTLKISRSSFRIKSMPMVCGTFRVSNDSIETKLWGVVPKHFTVIRSDLYHLHLQSGSDASTFYVLTKQK